MPKDAQGALVFESSAPGVVSVDAVGQIKALKEGTATITVKMGDTASEKLEITVEK